MQEAHSKRHIYLDHAAATPIDPRVIEVMTPYFGEIYGNPSSLHYPGLQARAGVERARSQVARVLGTSSGSVIFTSGGTESANLAIFGAAYAHVEQGRHIVVSAIEHKAVLDPCKQLEREGFEVTYLPVGIDGIVRAEDIEAALRDDTTLLAVMYANNEIGTIQPIREIGEMLAARRKAKRPIPLFFTDACQAAGALSLNVDELGVDLMALSGAKVCGPKGVGCLYVRKGVVLEPHIVGGGQERGLRSGTENVAGIVGLSEALTLAEAMRTEETVRLTALRDRLIREVESSIDDVTLNGHPTQRLPNNAHFTFAEAEGEALVLALNERGIFCSTGSACSSSDPAASHVLAALGRDVNEKNGGLRFTLGRSTTEDDIGTLLASLPEIVTRVRSARK